MPTSQVLTVGLGQSYATLAAAKAAIVAQLTDTPPTLGPSDHVIIRVWRNQAPYHESVDLTTYVHEGNPQSITPRVTLEGVAGAMGFPIIDGTDQQWAFALQCGSAASVCGFEFHNFAAAVGGVVSGAGTAPALFKDLTFRAVARAIRPPASSGRTRLENIRVFDSKEVIPSGHAGLDVVNLLIVRPAEDAIALTLGPDVFAEGITIAQLSDGATGISAPAATTVLHNALVVGSDLGKPYASIVLGPETLCWGSCAHGVFLVQPPGQVVRLTGSSRELFVAPGRDDYRLHALSSARNQGVPARLSGKDIDGRPRGRRGLGRRALRLTAGLDITAIAQVLPPPAASDAGFSIVLWVRFESGETGTLLAVQAPNDSVRLAVTVPGPNSLQVLVAETTVPPETGPTPVPHLVDGRWHQIALAVAASGASRLLIDGVVIFSAAAPSGYSSPNSSDRIVIGGLYASGSISSPLSGTFDEVLLFGEDIAADGDASTVAWYFNQGVPTDSLVRTFGEPVDEFHPASMAPGPTPLAWITADGIPGGALDSTYSVTAPFARLPGFGFGLSSSSGATLNLNASESTLQYLGFDRLAIEDSSWTVAFWVRFNASQLTRSEPKGALLTIQDPAELGSPARFVLAVEPTTGSGEPSDRPWQFSVTSGGVVCPAAGTVAQPKLSDSRWHCVVVRVNGPDAMVHLDGPLLGTFTKPSGAYAAAAGDVWSLGAVRTSTSAEGGLALELDEVAFWSDALQMPDAVLLSRDRPQPHLFRHADPGSLVALFRGAAQTALPHVLDPVFARLGSVGSVLGSQIVEDIPATHVDPGAFDTGTTAPLVIRGRTMLDDDWGTYGQRGLRGLRVLLFGARGTQLGDAKTDDDGWFEVACDALLLEPDDNTRTREQPPSGAEPSRFARGHLRVELDGKTLPFDGSQLAWSLADLHRPFILRLSMARAQFAKAAPEDGKCCPPAFDFPSLCAVLGRLCGGTNSAGDTHLTTSRGFSQSNQESAGQTSIGLGIPSAALQAGLPLPDVYPGTAPAFSRFEGVVYHADGAPADVRVRLAYLGLSGRHVVGEEPTSPSTGRFAVSLDLTAIPIVSREGFDLELELLDATTADSLRVIPIQARTQYTFVELTISEAGYSGAAEFDSVAAIVERALDLVPAANFGDEQVAFVESRYQIERRVTRAYLSALSFSTELGLPAWGVYALIRQSTDLVTDLLFRARLPIVEADEDEPEYLLRPLLNAAVEQRQVSPRASDSIPAFLAAIRERVYSGGYVGQMPIAANAGVVARLVGFPNANAAEAETKRGALVVARLGSTGTEAEFYTSTVLDAVPGINGANDIQPVLRAYAIVEAVRPDVALAAQLLLDPSITGVADLVEMTADQWILWIQEVPPGIEDAQAYAEHLHRRFRGVARSVRVRAGVASDVAWANTALRAGLVKAPKLELGSKPLKKETGSGVDPLTLGPDVIPIAADPEETEALFAANRLIALLPSDDDLDYAPESLLKILFDEQLTTASSIAGQGCAAFMKKADGLGIPEPVAHALYGAAAQTSGLQFQVQSELSGVSAFGNVMTSTFAKLSEESYADLKSLFRMKKSYCTCEHCRSVLSPAAYFVDLVDFLDRISSSGGYLTARNVLLGVTSPLKAGRRPDFRQLPLTCANTNTVMPTLDLVIEVLEQAVLNQTLVARTTSRTAAELRALPEHLDTKPYETLRGEDAYYPWSLPFDFWETEAGLFMDHLGVHRYRAVEAGFAAAPFYAWPSLVWPEAPATAADDATAAVVRTWLKMGLAGWKLLTEASPTGVPGSTSLEKASALWGGSIPSEVDKVLKVTGLTFVELEEIVATATFTIDISRPIDAYGVASCDVAAMTVTGLNSTVALLLHRFVRLYRATDWRIRDLDRLLVLRANEGDVSPGLCADVVTIELLASRSRTPVADLLALWHDFDSTTLGDRYAAIYLAPGVHAGAVERFEDELRRVERHFALPLPHPDPEEDSDPPLRHDVIRPVLLGALRLGASDLDALFMVLGEVYGEDAPARTLANLSRLFRWTWLRRATGLEFSELLTLRRFAPSGAPESYPFGSPSETATFLDRTEALGAAGLVPSFFAPLLTETYGDGGTSYVRSWWRTIGTSGALETEPILIQLVQSWSSAPAGTGAVGTARETAFTGSLARHLKLDEPTTRMLLVTFPMAKVVLYQLTYDATAFAGSQIGFIAVPAESWLPTLPSGWNSTHDIAPTALQAGCVALRILERARALLGAFTLTDEAGFSWLSSLARTTPVAESPNEPFPLAPLVLGRYLGMSNVQTWQRLWFDPPVNDASSAGVPTALQRDRWLLTQAITMTRIAALWRPKETAALRTITTITTPGSATDATLAPLFGLTAEEIEYLRALQPAASVEQLATNIDHHLRFGGLVNLKRRLNAPDERLGAWIAPSLLSNGGVDSSTQIRGAALGLYGAAGWAEKLTPVRDTLRERQRDALLAWVLAKGYSPPGAAAPFPFDSAIQVSNHFLVDVEVSACAKTTRLRQALSSVQWFVQRILLRLELPVNDPDLSDVSAEWTWRKLYRVWEANRKLFLFPENWLTPDLRTDRSIFFQEFEDDLARGALDKEAIRKALLGYLEKVEEISLPEVRAVAVDTRPEGPSTVHVLARTRQIPHRYYYRTRTQRRLGDYHGRWSPWERIDAQIESDHTSFLLLRSFGADVPPPNEPRPDDAMSLAGEARLVLGWPIVRERPAKTYQSYGSKGWESRRIGKLGKDEEPANELLVSLAWTERTPDGWSKRTIAPGELPISLVEGVHLFPYVGTEPREWGFFRDTLPLSTGLALLPTADGQAFELLRDWQSAWVSRWDLGTSFVYAGRLPLWSSPDRPQYPFGAPGYREAFELNAEVPKSWQPKDQTGFRGNAMIRTWYPYPQQHYTYVWSTGTPLPDVAQSSSELQRFAMTAPGLLRVVYPLTRHPDTPDVNGFFVSREQKTLFITVQRGDRGKAEAFYHAFADYYLQVLRIGGLDALYTSDNQGLHREDVTIAVIDPASAERQVRREDVAFRASAAYSQYNWELFFHAPVAIATRLTQRGRFADAQAWLHRIFDPTSRTGTADDVSRFWKFRPFLTSAAESMETLLIAAHKGEKTNTALDAVAAYKELIAEWHAFPFEPHRLGRLRIQAYQRAVVMQYLDNLIAWGDDLFERDTLESVNEALQIYFLAAEILGEKPVAVAAPPGGTPFTYETAGGDGEFVKLVENQLIIPPDPSGTKTALPCASTPTTPVPALAFCFPVNDKLLAYWDTVADRLFKIRHCRNLQGQVRQLPIYEPPIDPGLIARAKAMGLSLENAVSEALGTAVHPYRFEVLIQRARQACDEVRALGGALQAALEKRDGEALQRLRTRHEREVLHAVRAQRESAIAETRRGLDGLERQRDTVEARREYYATRTRRNPEEVSQGNMLNAALFLEGANVLMPAIAAVTRGIPEFVVGLAGLGPLFGTETGGKQGAEIVNDGFNGIRAAAGLLQQSASIAGLEASYARRDDDWKFQQDQAAKELKSVEQQILAAQIRIDMAERELENHDRQRDNAAAIEDLLASKFSRTEFFDWSANQLRSLHKIAYDHAHRLAKFAEAGYNYQLAPSPTAAFVKYAYYNPSVDGILAGDTLAGALRDMESKFFEGNERLPQLTKHISLVRDFPIEFMALRTTGVGGVGGETASIVLSEAPFAGDRAQNRRVRRIALSVLGANGPHGEIRGTLTGEATSAPTVIPKTIHLSRGIEDTGVLDGADDGRYVPFEGYTIEDTTLTLSLRQSDNSFDVKTVSDVIIRVDYSSVGVSATNATAPTTRLFSAKRDFPDAWEQLKADSSNPRTLAFSLTMDHFAFKHSNSGGQIGVTSVDVWTEGADLAPQLTKPGGSTATSGSGGSGKWTWTNLAVPDATDSTGWKLEWNASVNDLSDVWFLLTT